VRLAFLRDLPPVGTVAHEWVMAHAAMGNYRMANWNAMMAWYDVYQGALGTALSDTYTSAVFRSWFHGAPFKLFDAVRQDSGDPIAWAQAMVDHLRKQGVDPATKRLVFSDGLTVPRCIEIDAAVRAMGGVPSFLIGTDLTCDVPGVTPLNMVLKMTAFRPSADDPWRPTVKLSDVPGKHSGDPVEVQRCKRELGIA
jgi:nicotinate phosphoribosyltransferase